MTDTLVDRFDKPFTHSSYIPTIWPFVLITIPLSTHCRPKWTRRPPSRSSISIATVALSEVRAKMPKHWDDGRRVLQEARLGCRTIREKANSRQVQSFPSARARKVGNSPASHLTFTRPWTQTRTRTCLPRPLMRHRTKRVSEPDDDNKAGW